MSECLRFLGFYISDVPETVGQFSTMMTDVNSHYSQSCDKIFLFGLNLFPNNTAGSYLDILIGHGLPLQVSSHTLQETHTSQNRSDKIWSLNRSPQEGSRRRSPQNGQHVKNCIRMSFWCIMTSFDGP